MCTSRILRYVEVGSILTKNIILMDKHRFQNCMSNAKSIEPVAQKKCENPSLISIIQSRRTTN